MNVGMALWALPLLLGSAVRWDGQARVGTQLIAGRSQSPFLTGPDSPPLANAALTGTSNDIVNWIVSPSGEVGLRARQQVHKLSYAPRLFLNPRQLSGKPTAYHIVSLKARWGRPEGFLATLSPQITIGGLDLGDGGSAPVGAQGATAFSGSTRPGVFGGIPASYVSFNALGRVEHPLFRGWRAGLQGRWRQMGASDRFGTPRNPLEVPLPGAGLRAMQQQEVLADADYLTAGGKRFKPEFAFAVLRFPSTQSYLTFAPAASLDFRVGAFSRAHLRLGALLYNTGVLPGFYNQTGTIAVAEAGIEHRLAALGLPKANVAARATVGPYIDLIFGMLEPRSSVLASAAYNFSSQSHLVLQGRYYSQRYPGRRVPVGHDKDLVMVNLSLRTRLTTFLSAQLGAYNVARRRNPSRTDTTAKSNEYFLFVGVDGTLRL